MLTADRSCNRSVPLRRGLVQEGVTEEKAMGLVVELPSFFTLPPAARERIGLFLGEVRRVRPPFFCPTVRYGFVKPSAMIALMGGKISGDQGAH